MQRVLAFIIGIPLLVALGWLTYLTIRKYLDDLKEKDFNAVEILGERDRLLTEVAKYILDAEGGQGKVYPEIHEKFRNLKHAITISQIEFATAELREVYEKEKSQMEKIWRLLEEQ